MNAPATLEQLVAARIIAKRQEDEAATHRKELDAQIAALAKQQLEDGKKSFSLKMADGLKLTVTFGVNRKVDGIELQNKWASLSAVAQASFRWKPEVVEANFAKLDGDDKLKVSEFVTTTDASPSIKLEVA